MKRVKSGGRKQRGTLSYRPKPGFDNLETLFEELLVSTEKEVPPLEKPVMVMVEVTDIRPPSQRSRNGKKIRTGDVVEHCYFDGVHYWAKRFDEMGIWCGEGYIPTHRVVAWCLQYDPRVNKLRKEFVNRWQTLRATRGIRHWFYTVDES